MDKIFKSQKRLKKYNLNRLAAWLLAVLMLFSALPTGSMTVHVEATDGNVAQIVGGNSYTSLELAIDAANDDDTIMLLGNIDLGTEKDIVLNKAITLDLNGKTLIARSFSVSPGTKADVVDNSGDKTGVLKVTNFLPAATNSQMPIYNGTDGYVFATMVEQVHRSSEMGADTFELIFKPYFGTATINELLKGGGNAAQVSIGICLEWTDANGEPQSKDLTYTDEMVKEVYAGTNKAFYIEASGATQFDDLTITPFVKSNTVEGLEWSVSEFKAALLNNGSFENGTTNWSFAKPDNTTTEITTEKSYEGTQSLFITGTPSYEATGVVTIAAYQDVEVTPGVSYTLSASAFVNTEYGTSGHPIIGIYKKSDNELLAGYKFKERGEWENGTITFTANEEYSEIYIKINHLRGGAAYYDDVTLVPAE